LIILPLARDAARLAPEKPANLYPKTVCAWQLPAHDLQLPARLSSDAAAGQGGTAEERVPLESPQAGHSRSSHPIADV
jgi:hypothetical protein